MRIATWNINSVRIRLPLLAKCIKKLQPDVLCLQETKVENAHFPLADLQSLGFSHIHFDGQKSYNGMAILSRQPIKPLATLDVLGNGEKRHIAVELENGTQLHNFYVPAGGDIPDPEQNPKFKDKLAFMDFLSYWGKKLDAKKPMIVVGDLNIAPLEHDVWSHKQLLNVVSHTPVEVEKMSAAQHSAQWVDSLREFVPHTEKLYSWWSYRNRDWEKSNRGRRLDHIWVSAPLKTKLQHGDILSEARGWESPSDHVPVMIDLAA